MFELIRSISRDRFEFCFLLMLFSILDFLLRFSVCLSVCLCVVIVLFSLIHFCFEIDQIPVVILGTFRSCALSKLELIWAGNIKRQCSLF